MQCYFTIAPAVATAWSFSTLLPDTPIAPITSPSAFLTTTPPGNVIKPPLECSILYNEVPGCTRELRSAVFPCEPGCSFCLFI